MGIAAYRRGNAVITRQTEEVFEAIRRRDDFARMVEIEVVCDEWRRAAMSWFVDSRHGDIRGFAASAVRELSERGDKVFATRLRKVTEAHAAALDVRHGDQMGRMVAAKQWAHALWRLLDWGRGHYKCEIVDNAPGCVTRG